MDEHLSHDNYNLSVLQQIVKMIVASCDVNFRKLEGKMLLPALSLYESFNNGKE